MTKHRRPKSRVKTFAWTIFLLLTVYWIWSWTGRSAPSEITPNKPVGEILQIGQDSGKGNFIGIQPWMETDDYADEQSFYRKLHFYLTSAESKGLLNEKTIAVFPEYIGSWLVAANEKTSVYDSPKVEPAMTTMALSNFFSFLKNYLLAPDVKDKSKYALFALKSGEMAKIYTHVFSRLAREFQITIVGGSIVLSEPEWVKGEIVTRPGKLYNITAVFDPKGKIQSPLVRKAYPTADELHFVSPGKSRDLPVFETASGKLGVLICADSWFPDAYARIAAQGANLLAIPSYSIGDGCWREPWSGYSGFPNPVDVKTNDVGGITYGDAWFKYSMGGRSLQETGIKRGINVFLRGKLWDLGTDGTTIGLRDTIVTAPKKDSPAIVCLWL